MCCCPAREREGERDLHAHASITPLPQPTKSFRPKPLNLHFLDSEPQAWVMKYPLNLKSGSICSAAQGLVTCRPDFGTIEIFLVFEGQETESGKE